ncbi:MAG: diguanylate cyclase [Acidovorax sp.]|jgi:diguanylate cyclase (GGDEF)-like protein
MLFRRKPSFSATDAFPLTEAGMEFDDSTADLRPERRALDGFGIRAQRNMRHQWIAALSMLLLYSLGIAGFVLLGVTDRSVLTHVVVGSLLGCVVFLLLMRTARFQSMRHRHLRLIVVALLACGMLLVVHAAPITQILLGPFAFLAIGFGVFTVPRRLLLWFAALFLGAYALLIAAHYLERENVALLRLEALHWLALVCSLPAFVLLMGKVQRLYRSLYQASRKIENIQEDAKRDTLVGCFNRRYVLAALEEQKQLADETGIPLCLAVLDLDHFKRINDDLGHLGGDEVLRTFSHIAQEGVRGGDVFGRYGGEEFLLIFPGTSLLPALNTCERIRAQVENHTWNPLLRGRVTVSIGVTQYVTGESMLEFFSRADTAMYMAKEGGRNQVVVEEPIARGDSMLSDSVVDSD